MSDIVDAVAGEAAGYFLGIPLAILVVIALPFMAYDKYQESRKTPQERAVAAQEAESRRMTKEEGERARIKAGEHPIREALKKKVKDKAVDIILK